MDLVFVSIAGFGLNMKKKLFFFLFFSIIFIQLITLSISAKPSSKTSIVVISPKDIEGGNQKLSRPQSSPNGAKILFTNNSADKLWILPAEPSKKPAKLLSSKMQCGLSAQWFTKNKILYVTAEEDKNQKAFYTIWLYDIDKDSTTRLSSASTDRKNPVIANNAIITPGAANDNNLLNIQSAQRLTDEFLTGLNPLLSGNKNISKTGQPSNYTMLNDNNKELELPEFIVYVDGLKLIKYNFESNSREVIDNRVISCSLAPDKNKIVYCKNNLIFIYSIDTGKKLEIGAGSYPGWIDDESIIFVQSIDDGHSINSSDIFLKKITSSAAPKNITNSPDELELYPSYDKKNKRIYFSSIIDNSIKYFNF